MTALLQRHVDPDTPGGLDSLRRVVVEAGEPELVVGRHAFRATEPPEVLDAAEVAELLQVGEADVVALAEAGDLPSPPDRRSVALLARRRPRVARERLGGELGRHLLEAPRRRVDRLVGVRDRQRPLLLAARAS